MPEIQLRYIFYTIFLFEYDHAKSLANAAKHGIDFSEAQQLWDNPFLIEIQAKSTDEPRFMVIGRFKNKLWSAVITRRSDQIRIISVRRSRQSEVALYES